MNSEHENGRQRGDRNVRRGTVVGRSGDKSVIVQLERRKRHPLYGKVVRLFKKVHVHDAENQASVGDKVQIIEGRPFSRHKRWRLLMIDVSRAGDALKASKQ